VTPILISQGGGWIDNKQSPQKEGKQLGGGKRGGGADKSWGVVRKNHRTGTGATGGEKGALVWTKKTQMGRGE